MRKNRLYSELTEIEIRIADAIMKSEMVGLDFKHPIRLLHLQAWEDFKEDKFRFDGATFSKRRNAASDFEVAALVHDWRNANGYVSYEVDNEMFAVMIALNYRLELILQRYLLTRFTFLNIIRHKLKGSLKNEKPKHLYLL